jgi:hypothetical protein
MSTMAQHVQPDTLVSIADHPGNNPTIAHISTIIAGGYAIYRCI